MPLDGHSYLVSQGWTGKGTGLRQGAISRPLAIPQKKNLAGLGKDRDEAFPFWDHLFSAAAKSIQLKVTSSDDESDTESSAPVFKRTTTGILSNRRPVTGVSAHTSGTSTPDVRDEAPRSNLLSIAKREAAKSNLYARFFRGPVLGPDDDHPPTQPKASILEVVSAQTIEKSVRRDKKGRHQSDGEEGTSDKKRKRDTESGVERRQRKKERKEKKEQKAEAKEERKVRRKLAKEAREMSSTEELQRQERKKQKRASKEKGKEVCSGDDDSTSKRRKKGKNGAVPQSDEDHCVTTMGDADTKERGRQELEGDPQEGSKKRKRKRKED
ncbi:hypothetical protein FPV67DRAFT_765160 [Lyophyllum atratum]|nr:hypothetical protein FPV67DRAFT_765160 [Lyophyllum atratum]